MSVPSSRENANVEAPPLPAESILRSPLMFFMRLLVLTHFLTELLSKIFLFRYWSRVIADAGMPLPEVELLLVIFLLTYGCAMVAAADYLPVGPKRARGSHSGHQETIIRANTTIVAHMRRRHKWRLSGVVALAVFQVPTSWLFENEAYERFYSISALAGVLGLHVYSGQLLRLLYHPGLQVEA